MHARALDTTINLAAEDDRGDRAVKVRARLDVGGATFETKEGGKSNTSHTLRTETQRKTAP